MDLKHPRSEREETDQSLGVERQKIDSELAKRRADIEQGEDKVMTDARSRADGILRTARGKADEAIGRGDADCSDLAAVEGERSREDDALRLERATADDKLSIERGAFRLALAAVFALEREQTDDHLHRERDRADDAIDSRDDFLAMVSHDLRSMVGGVAMSAALLDRIPCDGDVGLAIADKTARIQRYAARMTRLVRDLLDVVSIDAGRLAVLPQRSDTAELLRETIEVFEPIAAAKSIAIRTDERAGSLPAHYDHQRVLQVLANLVGNAIKFTPKGGTIDIVVELVDREVRFAVIDTGMGIATFRSAS